MSWLDAVLGIKSTHPEVLRKGASPPGLTYINHGRSRVVFKIDYGKYGSGNGAVLKYARTQYDKGLNKQEAKLWDKVKNTALKSYFCPVLDNDPNGEWLVMDYANPNPQGTEEAISEISTALEEHGIYPEDVHRDNIGLYNGQYVLIDYPWISGL